MVRGGGPQEQWPTKGQGLGGAWARTIDAQRCCASAATLTEGAGGTGMVHSFAPGTIARHDLTVPPILHLAYAKIYWRRIYEMDI